MFLGIFSVLPIFCRRFEIAFNLILLGKFSAQHWDIFLQGRDFEFPISEYDTYRHFFLGHYFRDVFEQAYLRRLSTVYERSKEAQSLEKRRMLYVETILSQHSL